MSTEIKTDGTTMTVFLDGEIDHHNAPSVREKTDGFAVSFAPEKMILDFSGVTFMDSSGIGLVMGRYKLVSGFGCSLEITGLSKHALRVMKLAGLDKIAKLSAKKEEKNNETA